MLLYIILIIVGFALLIVGADFLVDGASGIAKKFHIPEIIIGLTIVSIGTSKTLAEVEDLYRPYKQKKRTRATIAKEKGL